jgi:hypothetical protein
LLSWSCGIGRALGKILHNHVVVGFIKSRALRRHLSAPSGCWLHWELIKIVTLFGIFLLVVIIAFASLFVLGCEDIVIP